LQHFNGTTSVKLIPLCVESGTHRHVNCINFTRDVARAPPARVRRLAAWLSAAPAIRKLPCGCDRLCGRASVLWTFILINLKAAQDVHMDVAEAFAWGQKFQLGYGKHPPLAGWWQVSGFRMFRPRTGHLPWR